MKVISTHREKNDNYVCNYFLSNRKIIPVLQQNFTENKLKLLKTRVLQ